MTADDQYYTDLEARIDAGDVRPIRGTLVRGEEARRVGQRLLMEATGTDATGHDTHAADRPMSSFDDIVV